MRHGEHLCSGKWGEQKDLKNCSTFAGLYYEPVLAICDLIKKLEHIWIGACSKRHLPSSVWGKVRINGAKVDKL